MRLDFNSVHSYIIIPDRIENKYIYPKYGLVLYDKTGNFEYVDKISILKQPKIESINLEYGKEIVLALNRKGRINNILETINK